MTIRYISATGAGTGDGLSPENAYNGNSDLQGFLRTFIAGDIGYIQSGTYTQCGTFVVDGTLQNNIQLIGVVTLTGLVEAQGDDRPFFNLPNGHVCKSGAYWIIKNLRFLETTNATGYIFNVNYYCTAINIKVKVTNSTDAFTYESTFGKMIDCEAENTNGNGFNFTNNCNVLNCYAHDCLVGFCITGAYCFIDNCIAANCGKGFLYVYLYVLVQNCVAYNCTYGIYLNASRSFMLLFNIIVSECDTGIYSVTANTIGNIIKNICYYNNTTDVTNVQLGDSSVQADPKFVNAASGNFSLESTSPCIDTGITMLFGVG